LDEDLHVRKGPPVWCCRQIESASESSANRARWVDLAEMLNVDENGFGLAVRGPSMTVS
jgi:hypothetical protein